MDREDSEPKRDSIFTGAGTAIITPMNEDGSINYKKMEELLEFQIKGHADAIIVAGTTGESACLSTEEHYELVRFTCEVVNKRVPVIAGAGSNHTAHSQLLCENAESCIIFTMAAVQSILAKNRRTQGRNGRETERERQADRGGKETADLYLCTAALSTGHQPVSKSCTGPRPDLAVYRGALQGAGYGLLQRLAPV